jgi:hypothetical protein
MKTITRTLLCAWVLWGVVMKDYSSNPSEEPTFHPWYAYESRAACVAGLSRIKHSPYRLVVSKEDGTANTYDDAKGGAMVEEVRCFPDTVKPPR